MPAPTPDFSKMSFVLPSETEEFAKWVEGTPFNPEAPAVPPARIRWKEVYVLFRLTRQRLAEGRTLPEGAEYAYLLDKFSGGSRAPESLRSISRMLQSAIEGTLRGRPMPPEFEARMVDLLRMADEGDVRALELAAFVFEHPAFPQSRALNARVRVFNYQRAACERGYFAPLVDVARHLALGDGVAADREKAREWFGYALACDEPTAWCKMAHDLISGLHGMTDPVQAEVMLRRGIEAGQTGCVAELAILMLGRKLPGPDSALPLLTTAAQNLVAEALLTFGACLIASAQDRRLSRVGYSEADVKSATEVYDSGLHLVMVAAAARQPGAAALLAAVDDLPLWDGERGHLDERGRALRGDAEPLDISKGVVAAALALQEGPLPKGQPAAGPMERLDFESEDEKAGFRAWLENSPFGEEGALPDEATFNYTRLYLLYRASARRVAEGRELDAAHEFGYVYRQAMGRPSDLDRRCDQLGEAVSSGPDEAVIREILELAETTGHPAALFLAWGCHANGLGTAVDNEKAFECLRGACEAGYMGLAWHMVESYELGLGVEPDPRAAASWFRDALLFSIPGNAVSVAQAVVKGTHGQVDRQYAELHLRRSIFAGDAVAGLVLAEAMLRDILPDTGDIPALLKEAANTGSALAYYLLGEGHVDAACTGSSRVFGKDETLPGPKKLFTTGADYLRKAAAKEFEPAVSLLKQIRVYRLTDGSRATLAGGIMKEKKKKEAEGGKRR